VSSFSQSSGAKLFLSRFKMLDVDVVKATAGIQLVNWDVNGGVISCTVRRQAVGNGNDKIFDLNTDYYIFLGAGKVSDNGQCSTLLEIMRSNTLHKSGG
jgi:hypothetical protein